MLANDISFIESRRFYSTEVNLLISEEMSWEVVDNYFDEYFAAYCSAKTLKSALKDWPFYLQGNLAQFRAAIFSFSQKHEETSDFELVALCANKSAHLRRLMI